MTYQRRAYDDQATTREMHDDCSAAGSLIARRATQPAPSLRYDDHRETPKPEITISEATRRLAVVFDRD